MPVRSGFGVTRSWQHAGDIAWQDCGDIACRGSLGRAPCLNLCNCITRDLAALQTTRRSALGLLAAGAALVTRTEPSQAAYGESANIFGKQSNKAGGHLLSAQQALCSVSTACACPFACMCYTALTGIWTFAATCCCARCAGFVPYAGEGYALLLPSKWNPSKEKDFPGTALRCTPAATPRNCTLEIPVCRRQVHRRSGQRQRACRVQGAARVHRQLAASGQYI